MPSGPAAALGLKTRSALMSGDMDLATTTAAGAAQNAAAQAQSLAAAAAAPAPRLVLARRLGRDEHRVAVAARGAGAEQLGGASSPAGQSSSLAIVLLRVAQHLLQGALTFCSLSHLLTFAHFCSLSAHVWLTFC